MSSDGSNCSAVTYGLSSSTTTLSNTPAPPGTWLVSPTSCASKNAPMTTKNGACPGGSTTNNTAPASTQSTIDTSNWLAATVALGKVHLSRPTRIGRRRADAAMTYSRLRPKSSHPSAITNHGAGYPSSVLMGPSASVRPPSASNPNQNVIEYEITIRDSSSPVTPHLA